MQIFNSISVIYLHTMNETGELKQLHKSSVLLTTINVSYDVTGKTNAGTFHSSQRFKLEQQHSFSRNRVDVSTATLLFLFVSFICKGSKFTVCVCLSSSARRTLRDQRGEEAADEGPGGGQEAGLRRRGFIGTFITTVTIIILKTFIHDALLQRDRRKERDSGRQTV